MQKMFFYCMVHFTKRSQENRKDTPLLIFFETAFNVGGEEQWEGSKDIKPGWVLALPGEIFVFGGFLLNAFSINNDLMINITMVRIEHCHHR